MKLFDAHIHARNGKPSPERLLLEMQEAGMYGGCVFSTRPVEYNPVLGISFEERLEEVLAWSKGYEDRIFPILWIHPYEENIFEKIKIAALRGIAGFKIICGDFYISEPHCIEVMKAIASENKPVFFHSGILWDGTVSSEYNRPLHWESLLRIKGLRFSMGHCSWPWIDECIALYGEFLNSLLSGETAEMFFDITPGTPEIYREELLTKLYTIGYDVGDNAFFGTDANASCYRGEWVTGWLKRDGEILDKLGVCREVREKLYYHNLLRFLGKTELERTPASPEVDDAHKWSPVNEQVKKVVGAWYEKLGFPREFDAEFKKAMQEIEISDTLEAASYSDTGDGKRNLLSFLFMCEKLKERYEAAGISETILLDTLQDVVTWCNTWSDLKNELYLGECHWLKNHLTMKLFRLGRLQFCMGGAYRDIPRLGISRGDSVIEVHIPEGEPLDRVACQQSLAMAKTFFAEYFPDFDYKCFTCHSWLLDRTLADVLGEDSRIMGFQSLFSIEASDESDAILRYVFSWNTTRRTLRRQVPFSSLAKKVKERALSGGVFYEGFGVIER